MYELICRSIEKRTTSAEEARLRAWREASAENEEMYADFARLGELAGAVVPGRASSPPAAAEIVARSAGARVARTRGIVAWGGGVALATAAVLAWLVAVPGRTPGTAAPPAEEYATAAGEMRTVLLDDGTVVRLAPESRLTVTDPARRDVSLEGTAFFAVTRAPHAPFRVRTAAGEAVVLGTRFELVAQRADLRLLVVEGKVALGPAASQVVVKAGEMGRVSDGVTSEPVEVGDPRPMLSWLDRFIVFQDTPLAEAAKELEEVYDVQVQVTDSALAAQTLTGSYADRDFDEMLRNVCGILQAKCSVEGKIATISPGT